MGEAKRMSKLMNGHPKQIAGGVIVLIANPSPILFIQVPDFISIKVNIPTTIRSRKESVGQDGSPAVKSVPITMKTMMEVYLDV